MATLQTVSSKKTTSKSAAKITSKKPQTRTKTVTDNAAQLADSAHAKSGSNKTITLNKKRGKIMVAAEDRYKMIAAAAYLRSERRGFVSGHALDDWVAAEAEIDRMLKPG